jgi:signal peptidase I
MEKESKTTEVIKTTTETTEAVENTASEIKPNEKKKNKIDEDTLLKIFIGIALTIIFLNLFIIQLARVNGDSMLPTMENGQMLLVSKIEDTYNRGDIVIVKEYNSFLIKRIIALPGETLTIVDNIIYINGEPLDDYVDVNVEDWGVLAEGITLTDEQYIILGDNRNRSSDSRDFGPIELSDIKSKVIVRFYPFTLY